MDRVWITGLNEDPVLIYARVARWVVAAKEQRREG